MTIWECRSCRYFESYLEQSDDGDWQNKSEGMCRRYPPLAPVAAGSVKHGYWPRVEVGDWCGEYTACEIDS